MKLFGWLSGCVLLCAGSAACAQASAPEPASSSAPSASAPAPVASAPAPAPIGAASGAIAVRVESMAPIKIQSEGGAPWWATLIPLIGSIVSSIVALGGVIWSLRIARDNTTTVTRAAQQTSEASIWQKANEAELTDIQAKLDGFYMPFWLLSEANNLLATDVKSRQPPDYRLLVKLFDKDWLKSLSAGDRKLVEMICENAEELRTLIVTKSGLVDGVVLEYLSRASVHFRILHRAYKNELGEDASRFLKYVYPRQLDGVVSREIERLKARKQTLRSKPGECPPAPPPLVIPNDLKLPPWTDAAGASA